MDALLEKFSQTYGARLNDNSFRWNALSASLALPLGRARLVIPTPVPRPMPDRIILTLSDKLSGTSVFWPAAA